MGVEYGCRYLDLLASLVPVAGSLVVCYDALILWWKLWIGGKDGVFIPVLIFRVCTSL